MFEVRGPLAGMRERFAAEGGVFWLSPKELAVFDGDAARESEQANHADLTMPARLVDVLTGRDRRPLSWQRIRSAWVAKLKYLSSPGIVAHQSGWLRSLVHDEVGPDRDVVALARRLTTRSLLPLIIGGLDPQAGQCLERDVDAKFCLLTGERITPWRLVTAQVSAGRLVRKEIRARAAGGPRRHDLCDPIVTMLPELGIDRAVDAVTALLTSIVGSPAGAAACLLYELATRPDWADRLAAELSDTTAKNAPLTAAFVKETLRMWVGPTVFPRTARTEITLPQATLTPGKRYRLSLFMVHHDPRHWSHPDVFDPARWLGSQLPAPATSYVPFGWRPRTCIAAGLALSHLTELCRLFSLEYRLTPVTTPPVTVGGIALPLGFRADLGFRAAFKEWRSLPDPPSG